ncbi:hypothetical protein J7E96_35840 [Streptomyces sp. ISL-96]|uniref:hypothetical protein n=1 Tax=Streptomyces sp. ISL-96 TaxID=2819191 RepID=UPI001BEAE3BC|nr:hypothetical protein [Streptomyces sp. ISL-96]MBT2493775.1 hypothetical protein [Streptomyces sp. ISL-96]
MVTHDSTAALSFQVQQEFHETPLGAGVAEEVLDEQMREFSRAYWGDREEWEPLRRMFAGMQTANAQQLASGGAIYQAMGIFPLGGTADGSEPPERVSRCTLLVSVRELDNPDPAVSVAGITEALSRTNDGGETQLVSLPVGPAVLNIAGSRAVWNLADGEQERFLIRIELWLPFPTENRLLLFCLSTSDVEDLFMYQAVLADIADTITFGDTEHAETDAEAEPGLKSDFG